VVDSCDDDTVASFQVVRTIIENKIDAAEDDRVEVDGVGVVHIRSLSRFEMDEGPSHESWGNVQIQIGAPAWRSNRGRRGIGPVDELATHRDGELCLLNNARASDSIHACDKSSHGVHIAIFGCAVSDSSPPTASNTGDHGGARPVSITEFPNEKRYGLSALEPSENVQRQFDLIRLG
jgi:hypothetical protein